MVAVQTLISGATAQETAATIQQFSQALGSGVLRGEEFNTLAESSPRLLKALADGLKVNVGALRDMAAQGKLTADVIADALIGQLPKLSAEAAELPDTFSGAMTRVKNELQQVLKEFDNFTGGSDRIVGVVNSLAEGFGDIADAIKRVNSGEFSDFFRDDKATVAGVNNEISVLLSRVRDLQNARSRLSKTDQEDTVLFKFKFYSKAEFDAELKELQQHIENMKQARQKMIAGESADNEQRKTQFDMHAAEMKALRERSLADTSAILEQQVKDTKDKLAEQVAAERKAASDLASAKKAQLDTQQRYQEALAKVNGGAAGDPSYASANALKVSARDALQSGDVEGAKRQAQAALAVIEQLAAAGENTYGFGGFIKELEAIEQAADQKGIDSAQQKLEEAQKAAAATKAALEELKNVKVAATLSPEDEQKLLDQLSALAKKAGIILTIPVTPVMPAAGELDAEGYAYVPNNPPDPQFATGGYTGPGGVYEPAGVVHRGEVVWSQLDIARAGGVAVVEAMRRGMRGYSVGGIVAAPRLMPAIPSMSPSLLQQSSPGRDLGRVDLNIGGESFSLLAEGDQFDRILSRTSRKFGRTHR